MKSYTVVGASVLGDGWPIEDVIDALMDCAADIDEDGSANLSVSGTVSSRLIEIECIVEGSDDIDALANGKILIHEVCTCAELPVDFENRPRPCPTNWTVDADEPDFELQSASA